MMGPFKRLYKALCGWVRYQRAQRPHKTQPWCQIVRQIEVSGSRRGQYSDDQL